MTQAVELDFNAASVEPSPASMGIAMKHLIMIAALVAPAAAFAAPDGDARKGEQMVCRPIKETGSRLSKKKVCMTRDQWAEQKRIMRTDLNQAQTRRNEPSAN
jgi:hypothetical protein